MHTLDDPKVIEKLDKGHTLESILQLPDQCQSGWEEARKVPMPEKYKTVNTILFTGMGGSAYAARIIKSLFFDQLKVTVDIVNDYHLPAYVDGKTLIVAASYSGGTEETLSCIEEAIVKGINIVGVASGGKLVEVMTRNVKPVFSFVPTFNPSMQPRLGQGYMQLGQIALLASLGFISVEDKDVKDMIGTLRKLSGKYLPGVPVDQNPAKQLAIQFSDKIVNLVGAEFLEGAIHAIRNPIHETGKHFANYFLVPELNHHLMEGLMFPAAVKTSVLFTLINSALYSPVIQKRMKLTKDVITQNGVAVSEVSLVTQTKLAQVFELIQLGSFVTFYLAMLHGVDPAKIPWVDYFKEKLKN